MKTDRVGSGEEQDQQNYDDHRENRDYDERVRERSPEHHRWVGDGLAYSTCWVGPGTGAARPIAGHQRWLAASFAGSGASTVSTGKTVVVLGAAGQVASRLREARGRSVGQPGVRC